MDEISDRVKRGAELLDERVPGWVDRIDPAKLVLNDCTRCVLGQLYGDYENGTIELDIEGVADDYGFDDEKYRYQALTAAWRSLIRSRRAANDG